MKRVLIAFFLAPLLVSIPLGVLALIAYPIMLVITLLFAAPLFFLLKRLRWLQWWHASLAGVFCGLCYILFDDYMSQGINIDSLISSNNILYIGLGSFAGIIFWFSGIYKNPEFQFVAARFPLTILVVIPLVVVGYMAKEALQISNTQGRVVEILKEPKSRLQSGLALVRLTSGAKVEADLSNTWPSSMVEGKCFHLTHRWSTLRLHWVYKLSSPFGGGVDDC